MMNKVIEQVKTHEYTAGNNELIDRLKAEALIRAETHFPKDAAEFELTVVASEIEIKLENDARYKANPVIADAAFKKALNIAEAYDLDFKSGFYTYVVALATAREFDSIIDEFQDDDTYVKHNDVDISIYSDYDYDYN